MIELNSSDSEQITYAQPSSATENKGVLRRIARWDKVIVALVLVSLLLAFAALVLLATPILNAVFGFMGLNYTIWNNWVAWATEMDRGLLVAVAVGLAAVLVALLARYRMLREYSFYVEAGCPQCHENELIRVQRHSRDRVLAYFGIPVRRYSCRNCTWHGLRFAGYRYAKPGLEIEPVDVEPLETPDEWVMGVLPTEQMQSDLPADHSWAAANGAAAEDRHDTESGGPDGHLGFAEDKWLKEGLADDARQETVLDAAVESDHDTSVEFEDTLREGSADNGEGPRHFLEVKSETTGDALKELGEDFAVEKLDHDGTPEYDLRAVKENDHDAAAQIEATPLAESTNHDGSQEHFADVSDQSMYETAADVGNAMEGTEPMAASGADAEREAPEEKQASGKPNGSESASSIMNDEEFERLCEQVALSKK